MLENRTDTVEGPTSAQYAVRRLWAPVLLTVIASLLVLFSEPIFHLIAMPSPWRLSVGQGFEIAIWLTGALLFNRLFGIAVWDGLFTYTYGRKPPRLIVQLGGVVIFLLALSGIIGVVFGQSITALWATSGAIGVVVGFALQNLILDTFSGLAINVERPFKVGDWITVHTRFGEYIGRVEETNWRTTRLWTTGRSTIIVPNSFMTTTLVTNFSKPEGENRFELDFVLDFSVDSARAIRIIYAGIRASIGDRGPLSEPPPKVRASGVTEYGVLYKARYYLNTVDVSPSKARNTIIGNVLDHIRHAGLTLSYPKTDVFNAPMPWRQQDWSSPKDQARQLGKMSLFSALSQDDVEFIVARMLVHAHTKNDQVVEQGTAGDSMFILAEGLLEVFVENSEGKNFKVADLAPGTFFGEKSMLTGERRSATITCATDAVICEITKDVMMELFQTNTAVAELLSRAIAIREVQNNETIQNMERDEISDEIDQETNRFLSRIRGFFGMARA